MNRMRASSAAMLILLAVSTAGAQTPDDRNWPQWRGPTGNGVAPHAKPPVEWAADRNIRWKVTIPGSGHAAPIVWEDRIYVLSAVPVGGDAPAPEWPGPERGGPRADAFAPQESGSQPPPEGRPRGDRPPRDRDRGRGGPGETAPAQDFEFVVLALDRASGKTVWSRTVRKERPHEGMHNTASFASASPITDGQRVYAFFGSRGLHCLDLGGEVLWSRDFGKMRTRNSFGEGASPAIFGDKIVVVWDHEESNDFVVALNKLTGEELWRTPRDEPTTWTTPYIVEISGKPQVVVAGTNKCVGYDLDNGKVLWETGGLTMNVIPTPVFVDGLAILMSGFRGASIKAIRLDQATGTLADGHPAIVWTADEKTPYVPSPVLVDGLLYYYDNNRPILTCRDARTGEVRFGPERVDGLESIYASPLAAGGHIYLVGRSGQTTVLRQGPAFAVAATNKLDDEFNASPAAVDGELYLRGRQTLYCIASN